MRQPKMRITSIKRRCFKGLMLSALLLILGLIACTIQPVPVIAASISINPLKHKSYQQAAQYSEENGGRAMVAVRAGKVVFESYAPAANSERALPLASGTKSFSCAISLLGVQDGLLSLDEPVADTITEWQRDSQKSQITIRQLLNLTSGIPGGTVGSIPSYAEAITTSSTANPGIQYQYGPVPFQIFGEVMRRKFVTHDIPETPLTYLNSRIFQPIGLTYARWTHQNGQPNLSSGAVISAREWAKYGVLVLNKGQWQGRQLLDSQQLQQCFQGTTINPAYGLTFWLNKDGVAPSGQPMNHIPTTSDSTVMAIGAGNQVMFVIPERQLVVVRQGGLATSGRFDRETFLNLALGAN